MSCPTAGFHTYRKFLYIKFCERPVDRRFDRSICPEIAVLSSGDGQPCSRAMLLEILMNRAESCRLLASLERWIVKSVRPSVFDLPHLLIGD